MLLQKPNPRLQPHPRLKYLKFGSGALLIGGGVFVALRS